MTTNSPPPAAWKKGLGLALILIIAAALRLQHVKADPPQILPALSGSAGVYFDEGIYWKLNTGRLAPILNTLKTLAEVGVWFEIINLVVPTWTDSLEMIKRMCGWLVENLGPDRPLHFSRFNPLHKLTQLWCTPLDTLLAAREAARSLGLRYVYVGNVRGADEVQDTFCPNCRKTIIRRDVFTATSVELDSGRCRFCKTPIAGVWG